MSFSDVQHTRPVWAEVSAGRLVENYRAVRAAAETDVLAVIKANAYGHGAAQCAPVLAAAGARWLGVTSVEEGVIVRRALGILPQGVSPRVLVMCGVWFDEAETCLRHGLTPVVWEPYQLDLLESAAAKLRCGEIAVHVEIDTGMARQGVQGGKELEIFTKRIQASSWLRCEGAMTHLASAECTGDSLNAIQMRRFCEALRQMHAFGVKPELIHAGNTSAIGSGLVAREMSTLVREFGASPMTRSGLALFGYSLPLEGGGENRNADWKPVMTWKTRIVSLRDVAPGATVGYNATFVAEQPMRLALLPVGYADGFRRALSSRRGPEEGGKVLVRGMHAPVVGRVSMDLTVVDVTSIPDAMLGDEAVLLGGQNGQSISAEEHARLADTSVYEVLCAISDRVDRVLAD